jgi:DNA-directed RNA polymerase specialized sigma24 family protein
MSDARVTALDRLDLAASAEQAFQMDEDGFGAFYERTSRPLWLYLARTSGDARLADDLLHETYYRVLRSGTSFESDDHRRHYLFRVAANLVRDTKRRHGTQPVAPIAPEETLVDDASERGADRRPSDSTCSARSRSSRPGNAACSGWLTCRAAATKKSRPHTA